MEIVKTYTMNTETSVVLPYYMETGELCSMVMEGDKVIYVKLKPTTLIDTNLRMNGTSLRGAMDGAKIVLGSSMMPPIMFSKKHKMYWTPTESPQSPSCIWIGVSHIESYVPDGKKGIIVTLRNGSTIDVACSFYKFKQRVTRAHTLQCRMENQSFILLKSPYVCTQRYCIRKNKSGVNYELGE